MRKTVKPAIAEGAEKMGRDPAQVELVTSVFVMTGESNEEIGEQREKVRAQIAFYASTPTYQTVLEAHGWEEVGEKLGALARDKKWKELPELVTDEMLRAFAIEAAPDEVRSVLKERYENLLDRVALYIPFAPGRQDGFWRTTIESVQTVR